MSYFNEMDLYIQQKCAFIVHLPVHILVKKSVQWIVALS